MNEDVKTRIARAILDGIRTRGIPDAIAGVSESRSVSVVYREGRPDRVEESSQRSMSVSLYDHGKYSVSSSNDFRPDALSSFLDNAVALTRAMEPDPFRQITDPALYAESFEPDLELYDPTMAGVSDRRRRELAAATEAAALQEAGDRAISAEATVETEMSESVQLHSNGFAGTRRGTGLWLVAEVTLRDTGDRRPSGYGLHGSRFATEAVDPQAVGVEAVTRARMKLEPKRVDTRQCPMVIENRAVGRFLGGFLGATSGRALQQKRSFLTEMEGQRIGSDHFTVVNDPFIPRGFASMHFDSEGIAARRMNVVHNGLFENFFIDTYYARKLDRAPTTGDRANLILLPGQSTPTELISSVPDGFLVRGFLGGNTNGTTGDFSLGVYGTRIENGELTHAVSELNISGNHKDIWNRLQTVGNDPWLLSSTRCPTLLFDNVQFSGN